MGLAVAHHASGAAAAATSTITTEGAVAVECTAEGGSSGALTCGGWGSAEREAAYAEREAAYAELARLEAEYANGGAPSSWSSCAIHVGGLEGELENEGLLEGLFERFGNVLAVTLRVRREIKRGKRVVSWALVSFSSASEAQAAVDGTAELVAEDSSAEAPRCQGMVTRMVDEVQAAQSTGGMGEVMRKHVAARGGRSNFYSRAVHLHTLYDTLHDILGRIEASLHQEGTVRRKQVEALLSPTTSRSRSIFADELAMQEGAPASGSSSVGGSGSLSGRGGATAADMLSADASTAAAAATPSRCDDTDDGHRLAGVFSPSLRSQQVSMSSFVAVQSEVADAQAEPTQQVQARTELPPQQRNVETTASRHGADSSRSSSSSFDERLAALHARFEMMHAAKLLTDEVRTCVCVCVRLIPCTARRCADWLAGWLGAGAARVGRSGGRLGGGPTRW
jgi:hypothetical protein